jgi:hypothetical protein
MRFVASIGLVLLALFWGAAAEAQNREDMQLCRAISDEAKRLACYDAIELAPGPRPKYEVVDLSDLKSYALSYRGQLVEVSGWIKPGAELFFLGTDAADARSVPIDFASLDRRARQTFLSACGDGCQATVQGRVTPVNFTTGIVADALIAH